VAEAVARFADEVSPAVKALPGGDAPAPRAAAGKGSAGPGGFGFGEDIGSGDAMFGGGVDLDFELGSSAALLGRSGKPPAPRSSLQHLAHEQQEHQQQEQRRPSAGGLSGLDQDAAGLLVRAGLQGFGPALAALGFTDLETLVDPSVLDDATLLSDVGMSKLDIRKFRGALVKDGALLAATVASRQRGAARARDGKKDGGASVRTGRASVEPAYGVPQQGKTDPQDAAPQPRGSLGASGRGSSTGGGGGGGGSSDELAQELKRAGLGKLVQPLAARGVTTVAGLKARPDAWLRAELNQSTVSVRKLRQLSARGSLTTPAVTVTVAADNADDDRGSLGASLAGEFGLDDIYGREQAKAAEQRSAGSTGGGGAGAASGAWAASHAPNGAPLAAALKQAALSRLLQPLGAKGVGTLEGLAAKPDAWLSKELGLAKVDLRRLRAVVPAPGSGGGGGGGAGAAARPGAQESAAAGASQLNPMLVASNRAAVAAAAASPLPAGWQAVVDPTSGGTYYYCEASGETTWARPTATGGIAAATVAAAGAALPLRSGGADAPGGEDDGELEVDFGSIY
jgi:hypothetical protein